jgi:hypothetical protein
MNLEAFDRDIRPVGMARGSLFTRPSLKAASPKSPMNTARIGGEARSDCGMKTRKVTDGAEKSWRKYGTFDDHFPRTQVNDRDGLGSANVK